jgi:hypothetical protein
MQASKITKQSCTDCYGVRLQCSFSLNSLNWYNLEKGRSQQFGVLMYKTINKMVPDYLSSKFTPTNVIHSYNLRHSDSKLFVPRPLTESFKKSFTYRGTVLWNRLPDEAVNATSVANFKNIIIRQS